MMDWNFYEAVLAFQTVPLYHLMLEGFLLIWVIWLLLRKSYNPTLCEELTEQEKEALINEWNPEPLVPDLNITDMSDVQYLISGKFGKYVKIDECNCLNLATYNYLGMNDNPAVLEAAKHCVSKFGVGSCGPRSFYGTTEVHLELEDHLAKFMNCEEAVLYPWGATTMASAIPSYSKRGDVILVDAGVHFAIQKGIEASRSQYFIFNHNDMNHLEQLLEIEKNKDEKNPKKAKITKRFVIVEGIYLNTGNICLLPQLVELRKKYKFRLFIDEQISFGTLGECGRGVFEYFNLKVKDTDLISGSLDHALGSDGGFTVGSTYILEYQRLASLAAGAIAALKELQRNTSILSDLRCNCIKVHNVLSKLTYLQLDGHIHSPIKHLRIKNDNINSNILYTVTNLCRKYNLAITVSSYLKSEEWFPILPSIRITVSCLLTDEDINKTYDIIEKCCAIAWKQHNIHP